MEDGGRVDDEIVCIARVAEVRLWIEMLRRGLPRLQETSEQRRQANDDASSRQDAL